MDAFIDVDTLLIANDIEFAHMVTVSIDAHSLISLRNVTCQIFIPESLPVSSSDARMAETHCHPVSDEGRGTRSIAALSAILGPEIQRWELLVIRDSPNS